MNTKNNPTNTLKEFNIKNYMNEHMEEDAMSFNGNGKIMTGYRNIDSNAKLYPGLYVIGAVSSLGKTTFVHQMCDQMAQNGEHIIYFSLEQTTLELVSKSLARTMAKNGFKNAMSALEIRSDISNEKVNAAKEKYEEYCENVTIVECNFNATIKDIEEYVEGYIKKYEVKPIVVVDYLQVIQPEGSKGMTSKELVDTNVRRLKILQSENNIAIILISSFNRQNYLSIVDFESFKESGGIEYTADVVWGLQLSELSKKEFESKKINEKRELIKEAKKANPRKIELVCLKNRFGVSSYNCKFNYYPKFDWFEVDEYDDYDFLERTL